MLFSFRFVKDLLLKASVVLSWTSVVALAEIIIFLILFDTVPSGSEQKNAPDACDEDDDVKIIFERQPTREQAELAARLMLPPAFFCYKNVQGYVSDDDNDGKI